MSEYESGCGYEIYTTEISDLFTGAKFITLSNVLYWRMGIILFGLQLTEIHINSQNEEIIDRRVLLNPGEFVIPSRDKFYVEGKYPYMYYILCILVLLFFFLCSLVSLGNQLKSSRYIPQILGLRITMVFIVVSGEICLCLILGNN